LSSWCGGIGFSGHESEEGSGRSPAEQDRLEEEEDIVSGPVNENALDEIRQRQTYVRGVRGGLPMVETIPRLV